MSSAVVRGKQERKEKQQQKTREDGRRTTTNSQWAKAEGAERVPDRTSASGSGESKRELEERKSRFGWWSCALFSTY